MGFSHESVVGINIKGCIMKTPIILMNPTTDSSCLNHTLIRRREVFSYGLATEISTLSQHKKEY